MNSNKYYENTAIRCPYYKRESKQEICCSGMFCGSVIHISFANGGLKKKHRKLWCSKNNFSKCPIALALKSYEEEG